MATDARFAPWRRLLADQRGATMVEFTLLVPLFLGLTFAVVEFGHALYWWTAAEKATQLGARMAVVRGNPGIWPPALPTENVRVGGFDFGQRCEVGACTGFATVTCTSASCPGVDFNAIVDRMQAVFPFMDAGNLRITYQYANLGFAGGPVIPVVTVELWESGDAPGQGMPFQFIALDNLATVLGGAFVDTLRMPPMRATLTGEDLNSAAPA